MTTLHVVTAGTASSGHPPVLLIQGTSVAGRAWLPQVEALAETFSVAFFDNRGIGQSPGRPGTLVQMGEDVLEVLDDLGWERAHLVGHSLGGLIAQQAALLAPERVCSLALLCTFPDGSATRRGIWSNFWLNLRTSVGTVAMRRQAFFELVSAPELAQDPSELRRLEEVFGRSLDALPPGTMRQVWAVMRADLRAGLPSLDLPALVVSAADDKVAPPEAGRRLAELLGTHHEVVPGGHACVVQAAGDTNALLLDFLRDPAAFVARGGAP